MPAPRSAAADTLPGVNVEHWVEQVDRELRAEGTAERAEGAKRYLKSELEYYGVRVPSLRAVVTPASGVRNPR